MTRFSAARRVSIRLQRAQLDGHASGTPRIGRSTVRINHSRRLPRARRTTMRTITRDYKTQRDTQDAPRRASSRPRSRTRRDRAANEFRENATSAHERACRRRRATQCATCTRRSSRVSSRCRSNASSFDARASRRARIHRMRQFFPSFKKTVSANRQFVTSRSVRSSPRDAREHDARRNDFDD